MKTDYLCLLLSTDWFLPFWSEIGIDMEDATRRSIQAGCRELVRKFIGNAKEYYQIDLSDDRRRESYSLLLSLLEKELKQSVATAATEVWVHGPEDSMRSALMLGILVHDLSPGSQMEGSSTLVFHVRARVLEAMQSFEVDPDRFSEESAQSDSAWDRYIQALFVETPTALPDILGSIVQERRMKELWNRICQRLTQSEIQDLISWYRTVVKDRGFPSDPVPGYIRPATGV